MENELKRDEPPMEMRVLHKVSEDPRSCYDCRNFRRGGFGWCRFFDKPTSGQVNGCFGFEQRK